jgi:hypothetical protein
MTWEKWRILLRAVHRALLAVVDGLEEVAPDVFTIRTCLARKYYRENVIKKK